jgi:hypothetical protein
MKELISKFPIFFIPLFIISIIYIVIIIISGFTGDFRWAIKNGSLVWITIFSLSLLGEGMRGYFNQDWEE